MKTPIEIRITAYIAAVTMVILSAAGIKSFFAEPHVITNSKVVVMPNDSLIALSTELARLRTHDSTISTVAADRLEIIYKLAPSFQSITDSLLALGRVSLSNIQSGNAANDADAQLRMNRYAEVMRKLEKIADGSQDLPTLFAEQTNSLNAMIGKHDTVYATLPDERRSWRLRLRALFNGKK